MPKDKSSYDAGMQEAFDESLDKHMEEVNNKYIAIGKLNDDDPAKDKGFSAVSKEEKLVMLKVTNELAKTYSVLEANAGSFEKAKTMLEAVEKELEKPDFRRVKFNSPQEMFDQILKCPKDQEVRLNASLEVLEKADFPPHIEPHIAPYIAVANAMRGMSPINKDKLSNSLKAQETMMKLIENTNSVSMDDVDHKNLVVGDLKKAAGILKFVADNIGKNPDVAKLLNQHLETSAQGKQAKQSRSVPVSSEPDGASVSSSTSGVKKAIGKFFRGG